MSVRILTGDCRQRMAELPEKSVQCCVTSPPYYGLRDYGVEGQIGLEPTLAEYIVTMVDVFRSVWRVLRDDGTLWLNCGDSYAAGKAGRTDHGSGDPTSRLGPNRDGLPGGTPPGPVIYRKPTDGLKSKDLMMVPARLAIALQEDGWYLRSDIIWSKPNPMPESVTDRPTSSHEHVFLLTKRLTYYYDADAVREPNAPTTDKRYAAGYNASWKRAQIASVNDNRSEGFNGTPEMMDAANGRNLRNVWTIATHAFPDAHFATFPPALVEPCIKAGTSQRGACSNCGAPWKRAAVRTLVPTIKASKRFVIDGRDAAGNGTNDQGSNRARDGHKAGYITKVETTGWTPTCACDADVVPCVVLDPFGGSGTTGLVADRLGRNAVLIELNSDYSAMSEARVKGDCPMFAEVMTS